MIRYPHRLMAFGVPSWALPKYQWYEHVNRCEFSSQRIKTVVANVTVNVIVNAPVAFSVILLQLVQAVKVEMRSRVR